MVAHSVHVFFPLCRHPEMGSVNGIAVLTSMFLLALIPGKLPSHVEFRGDVSKSLERLRRTGTNACLKV